MHHVGVHSLQAILDEISSNADAAKEDSGDDKPAVGRLTADKELWITNAVKRASSEKKSPSAGPRKRIHVEVYGGESA